MSVCMDTTSVPRWEEERRIAEGGRSVTILSFGDAALAQARSLVSSFGGRRVGWLRLPTVWGDTAAEVLERQLSAARVGWRLVLVGPEAAVLSARAAAVAGGLLDAEILPVPIDVTTGTRPASAAARSVRAPTGRLARSMNRLECLPFQAPTLFFDRRGAV